MTYTRRFKHHRLYISCICIMCIGMATHLDRKNTCTVIETNMVILFGAYLAYFSLTNQSREVTCDFGFASDVGDGCDGWYLGDRDLLKLCVIRLYIVRYSQKYNSPSFRTIRERSIWRNFALRQCRKIVILPRL